MPNKKRFQITIDEDLAKWIQTKFYNLSGFLNALARKKMDESNTQSTTSVYSKEEIEEPIKVEDFGELEDGR